MYLVIGGDSVVGGSLVKALQRRGQHTISSTRRRRQTGEDQIYLDYEDSVSFTAPYGVEYVFIVAAVTSYDLCENDTQSHQINVELIPRLAERLLRQGMFVTFVSTNLVFGGALAWPREDDPHAPGIAYARQKSLAESRLISSSARCGALDRCAVVRLTKVLDQMTPPIPTWMKNWSQGAVVEPFSDFVIAPISSRFVGDALATIAEQRACGNLHVSGAENVTYTRLAEVLAARFKVSSELIAPTTATTAGVRLPFKPKFSGLSMEQTTQQVGIEPQSLTDVVSDLVENREL